MKKVFLAVVVATAFFAPQVFAQAKNFEGFSLALSVLATGNKIERTASLGSLSASDDVTSHSNILGSQAQYAMALGDKFVLGIGASFGHGELPVAMVISTQELIKLKDTASIYLAPGFALSDTTLLYGKIAAISAKATYDGATITGTGYGLGMQYLANKNFYYQVELMQNYYNDNNFVVSGGVNVSDKYTSNILSAGIGYKF